MNNKVKVTNDIELKDRLVAINRVTKVTKGGRFKDLSLLHNTKQESIPLSRCFLLLWQSGCRIDAESSRHIIRIYRFHQFLKITYTGSDQQLQNHGGSFLQRKRIVSF